MTTRLTDMSDREFDNGPIARAHDKIVEVIEALVVANQRTPDPDLAKDIEALSKIHNRIAKDWSIKEEKDAS